MKPFKLDNIRKISRRETELVHALYEYLPATDAREKLHVAIRKILIKHLGQDIRYFLSSVERKIFNDFTNSLPEAPILMVLGLTPIDKKLIVHIDHHIANLVISKLLGGGETSPGDLKALTETEQGVLQYLIMQVLGQIYTLTGSSPRVHFRFEKFIFDPVEVQKIVSSKENVYIMTIDTNLLDQAGFVKLIFPDPFLEEISHMSVTGASLEADKKYFRGRLQDWGYIKTSVWAEAGNAVLSPLEINDLETGDVILFDETNLKITNKKKTEGKVLLHFGSAEGGVLAQLVEEGPKTIKCKLEGERKV